MPFYEGRLLNDPTVSRRLVNTQFGPVAVQDVTLECDNVDGAVSGDLRGVPFTLDLYDTVTGLAVVQGTFIIGAVSRSSGTVTITGTNLDLSALESLIPVGTVDRATFPLILAGDEGKCAPWVFGHVADLPLLYVRDDVIHDQFDYLLCRGTAAALTGVRRMTPGGNAPFVTLGTAPDYLDGYIELEPYPGMAGVLTNGNMETWAAGPAAPPTSWTILGGGATVAKNQTAGQFDEGATSASFTRAGTDCYLYQDLDVTAAPYGLPLSWWQGRTVTLNMRVRATVAGRARIALSDNTGLTFSAYHSGSGLFELLTVTRALDPAANVARISGVVDSGNTTAQFDDVRVFLKAKSWEETLRPDLFPGYTAIRCYLQQTDSAGAFYQLVGSVTGLMPPRNLATAVRYLLSDPTHGLGQTVDAASFAQAEIDAAFDYSACVLVDAPQVFLEFDDSWGTAPTGATVARDDSGHERHGVYHPSSTTPLNFIFGTSAGGSDLALMVEDTDDYVDIPYNRAFDPAPGWTMEVWYFPNDAADLTHMRLLAERLIGKGSFSGLSLFQQYAGGIPNISARVEASGGPVQVHVDLDPGDGGVTTYGDTETWLYVAVRVENLNPLLGILRLTLTVGRAGVLSTAWDTGFGALPFGEGKIRIGKWATGGNRGNGGFDKFAFYNTALSDARIAAHATAPNGPYTSTYQLPENVEQAAIFPQGVSTPPLYQFSFNEATVAEAMGNDGIGVDGAYVGAPTLQVLGVQHARRAVLDWNRAINFGNNTANYGVVATPAAFSGTKLTVNVWYKPAAQVAYSGIVEKTVAGVVNTGWLLFQEREYILWRVKPTTTGLVNISFALTPEDVGRWMLISATYDTGTLKLYRNGVLMPTTAYGVAVSGLYDSPVATAAGALYVGVLGVGGGALYPCQGDLDVLAIHSGTAFTQADITDVYRSGTWYPGGLLLDVALTEPRQAQAWLRQILSLYGMRLGVSTAGAWTLTIDAPSAAPTVTLRDGPGDGVNPNLISLRNRHRSPLKDAVRDFVFKYRKNMLTGTFTREQRYPVSTLLDAHGNRIGQDWEEESEVLRSDPAAGRVAAYRAGNAITDELVEATVEPVEGVPLFEGMAVLLIEPALDYAGETLRIREARKQLRGAELVLSEYAYATFLYRPIAFTVGDAPEP